MLYKYKKALFIFLFSLFFSQESRAVSSQKYYFWNQLRYENENFENRNFGAQLQYRYDITNHMLAEEQLNLFYSSFNKLGRFGFIFTIGTKYGYSDLREFRYALEYQTKEITISKLLNYNVRIRQEVRDFTAYDTQAFRFRVRNELVMPTTLKNMNLSLSSELNFYLNEYSIDADGFSSHRTIIGLSKSLPAVEWNFSYINDYKEEIENHEMRHILNVGLIF